MLDAQTLLLAAATAAGTNVFTARDWPSTPPGFPNIRLAMPRESKSSLGRTQPQFNTVATLAIHARCTASTSELAEAALEVLCGQIEAAILPNQEALKLQQFVSVDTDARTTSEGNAPLAEAIIQIGCEFYERFNPAPGVPLTQITLALPVNPFTADNPLEAGLNDGLQTETGDPIDIFSGELEVAVGESLLLESGEAIDVTIGKRAVAVSVVIPLTGVAPVEP